MIDENIMYGCHCDNCGEDWINEEKCISVFVDQNGILNEVRNDETWHTDGPFGNEKHYCPDCFTVNDNDELIINASRKKSLEGLAKEGREKILTHFV
jgi:hypothetical protein